MPTAAANGIEIDYEVLGPDDGRPLVLMRGLGTQRIQWHPGFCERLVAGGHQLVTFDNRDVGLSTHHNEAGMPDMAAMAAAVAAGDPPDLPYTIDDMADDVVGLMDVLGLETAHVAGLSMGGMITQTVGYRHPDRVRSLVSVMSGTGNPGLPGPSDAVRKSFLTPTPSERSTYIEHSLKSATLLAGPRYRVDEDARRELAGRCFDRAFDPAGVARQFVAIQFHGDRRPGLARITAPTLVIHGLDDPLVRVEAGRDTAASIPGAELLEIAGMGHDVAPGLSATIADAISAHTAAADKQFQA